MKNKKNIFFIQIGSNTGQAVDPISDFITKYGWSGILVEPVKKIFEQLLATYNSTKNLIFENAAISVKDGVENFYYLKESMPNSPSWHNEIGSLTPEILLSHKESMPNIEKYITTEKVTCMTFNTLLCKHNIKKVNLLHIDTEGHDFQILKTIDFNITKPDILIFEHTHLNKKDYQECVAFLKNQRYALYKTDSDIMALGSSAYAAWTTKLLKI